MFEVGLLLVSLVFPDARALSVEEAYQAIPHQRTVFDRKVAEKDGMSAEDSTALEALFSVVDESIVAKVEFERAKPTQGEILVRYTLLLTKVRAIPGKGPVGKARDLVVEALKGQQGYFQARAADMRAPASPRVLQELKGRSSRPLHDAFGVLAAGYPKQKPPVIKAFYDCLCALDFF